MLEAGVEQPQLVQLPVVDGEQHADVLPARPAVGELVLDDPLAERLGDDRPAVHHADRAEEPRPVGVRGRRSDAIDHRVRERAMTVGPVGE